MRRMEFLGRKPILLNQVSKVVLSCKSVANTLLKKPFFTHRPVGGIHWLLVS